MEELLTSHQSLATDSFSYSWLTNPSPSFDRLIHDSTINEDFTISLPVDKDFDFNVVLPDSGSESKSSSDSLLIHADEIFSGGCILPVYNNSITAVLPAATPVAVCCSISRDEKQRKKRQRFLLLNRILKKSFLILSKLGCSREGVRVDDLSRKVKEIRSRNSWNRTLPDGRSGGGAGGGKLKAYGSGEYFGGKMKNNNGYKDLRSVKSCNNSPWNSPSSQIMDPWQHHVEISIDDAILHCKRSFGASS